MTNNKILVLADDQYHPCFNGLGPNFKKQGMEPWILSRGTADDQSLQAGGWNLLHWDDIFPNNLIPSITERKLYDMGFNIEHLTAFEHAAVVRPDEFRAGYPFTINYIRDEPRAREVAICLIESFYRLFRVVQPAAVLTWNGRYLPSKAVCESCLRWNIPLFTFEIGWIPNTIYCDRGPLASANECIALDGTRWDAPLNHIQDQAAEAFLQDYNAASPTMVNRGIALSKKDVRDKTKTADSCKLALFACQVDWDTNIVVGSPYYKTNEMTVQAILDALNVISDNTRLIVKLHPLDTVDRKQRLEKIIGDKGLVLGDEIHLHSLLNAADVVIVRNSTVGFEAMCRHKPVVVLSPAKFAIPGTVLTAYSPGELAPALRMILNDDFRPDMSIWRQFLGHLMYRYLIWTEFNYFYSQNAAHRLAAYANSNTMNLLSQVLLCSSFPSQFDPNFLPTAIATESRRDDNRMMPGDRTKLLDKDDIIKQIKR